MAVKMRPHPDMEPAHPGEVLREFTLPGLELSVQQAAAAMKITRQMMSRLINKQAGVTPDMAIRLGRLCGNRPAFWLDLQNAYDLWHAEREKRAEYATIRCRQSRTTKAA